MNLRRRKLRAALTMLGVAIGTAAIVLTLSLGYGAEKTQMDRLSRATNLRILSVYPKSAWDSPYGAEGGGRSLQAIDDRVIAEIRRIPGVEAVTPLITTYFVDMTVTAGRLENRGILLTAVSARDFMRMYDLKEGGGFTGNLGRAEFVLSELSLMNFRDPKGKETWIDAYAYLERGLPLPIPEYDFMNSAYRLTLRWYPEDAWDAGGDPTPKSKEFRGALVGVIPAKLYDWSFSYEAVTDIAWVRRAARENREMFAALFPNDALTKYADVRVLADDVGSVLEIKKQLEAFGLNCYTQLQWIGEFREQIQTMQGFLSFIGAVSMLVAALSIANTMMMSIYERTRESGVMKVIGCGLPAIRSLFLAEAGYIGLIGGLFGLAFSYAASYALNHVVWLQELIARIMRSDAFGAGGDTASLIPPGLSLGVWAFVVLAALLSGVYPARRAMRLSSLAAIRDGD